MGYTHLLTLPFVLLYDMDGDGTGAFFLMRLHTVLTLNLTLNIKCSLDFMHVTGTRTDIDFFKNQATVLGI